MCLEGGKSLFNFDDLDLNFTFSTLDLLDFVKNRITKFYLFEQNNAL